MKLDIGKLKPCKDGLEWYSLQKSSVQAWNDCPRGDWMLWMAIRLGVDEKKIILAAAKCANTVRHLMKDERSTNAVDTAIAYAEGRATKEELKEARDEAKKVYGTTEADYAKVAAYASWAAFSNACWASDAAGAATDVAAAAASWAASWAADKSQEAKKANQLQTANICREILTDDIIKIIEKF